MTSFLFLGESDVSGLGPENGPLRRRRRRWIHYVFDLWAHRWRKTLWHWWRALRRRSQKRKLTWEQFCRALRRHSNRRRERFSAG